MTASRDRMTMSAFLAWEEQQEPRFEYDGFGPVPMPDSTVLHGRLSVRLVAALGGRLRGTNFFAAGVSMKVLAAGHIRYPDAVVVRLPVAPKTTVLTQPLVLFEIAGPETSTTDHTVKNREYRDTPSVARYVILERDIQGATVWCRDGDRWIGRIVTGDAVLALPEIGIDIPLMELYESLHTGFTD